MPRSAYAVMAGAAVGIALILLFGYYFSPSTPEVDYTNVLVFPNAPSKEHLTDTVVKKAVDASLLDPTARRFATSPVSSDLVVHVRYFSAEEVTTMKFDANGNPLPDSDFLPTSKPVIQVNFDSAKVGIPERPMVSVYLDSQDYHILKSFKSD